MDEVAASAGRALSLEEYAGLVGQEIGVSPWIEIRQERIDVFAEATGDHQWIHVDPQRAVNGPFGGTIAHGYLTLSLLPFLVGSTYRLSGLDNSLNYGLNKVRFPTPVPVGSRVRARVQLLEFGSRGAAFRSVSKVVIEIEGSDRPGCVAETVTLLVPEEGA